MKFMTMPIKFLREGKDTDEIKIKSRRVTEQVMEREGYTERTFEYYVTYRGRWYKCGYIEALCSDHDLYKKGPHTNSVVLVALDR